MRVRRQVQSPKFSEYFRFEFKYFNIKNNVVYNTQVFNGLSFSLLFTVICFVVGFFKAHFWALGLSNIVLISYLYFKTKKLAHAITVVRKVPKSAHEKNQLEVGYTISNETGFNLENLIFVDEFDGTQTGSLLINCKRKIPAMTSFVHKQNTPLDAGMGVKTFRPIKIEVTDELGLFHFEILFSQESEIEVFPYIEETPFFITAVSPDTIDFGLYEVAKRGDSNLFIGTREYRRGDPIKHINWRLTKKTNKVVVNEYEKNTNSYVTILLDLDLENQVGLGALSTWEAAKDLALSIAANEIKRSNHIQVLSNDLYIPFGTGMSQLTTLEKHFTYHELRSSGGNSHLRQLSSLPSGGQLYFICPMINSSNIIETIDKVKRLNMQGQRVVIFILDPYQELLKSIKGDMRLAMMELERRARAHFAALEEQLKSYGIPMINVNIGPKMDLNKQIKQRAMGLLEVK